MNDRFLVTHDDRFGFWIVSDRKRRYTMSQHGTKFMAMFHAQQLREAHYRLYYGDKDFILSYVDASGPEQAIMRDTAECFVRNRFRLDRIMAVAARYDRLLDARAARWQREAEGMLHVAH